MPTRGVDVEQPIYQSTNFRSQDVNYLMAVVDSAPVMIWVSGIDAQCYHFNERWLSFRGRTLDEEIGNGWTEGVHPEDYSFCLETYLGAFHSRGNFEMQYRLKRWDGVYRWILDTGVPLHNEGVFIGYIGSCIDITETKKVEEIVVRQKLDTDIARLDRLNVIGEIAAALGHEIRNPLTTVRGFLQIFQRKQDLLPYTEKIQLMIDELDRCDQIITGFLSLAKNKIANRVQADLNQIVQRACVLLQPVALMTNQQIMLNLSEVSLLALDEKEIRQLIINLVKNGMEAMSANKTVTISTYGKNRDVILEIADEGSGIDETIINRLGTPFVTSKENGVGIGLSVCYKIVSRHNAEMTYETGPEGTTFYVHFKRDQ